MNKPNMSLTITPALKQAVEDRIANFDEVELVYTAEQAAEEASRCLNCPGRYCSASCPIHTPIPEFIAKIRENDFASAHELIIGTNPMSAICCRVCVHERQCEQNCTRGIKGEPTAISRLERFISDWNRTQAQEAVQVPSNGKRVAIVGSGPAGLACAFELARKGYAVTVYEAKPQLGGIPVYGIPRFVLPRDILEEHIRELTAMGVTFRTGTSVGDDLTITTLLAEYSAVFVAIGSDEPVKLGVYGETLARVYTARDYLRSVNCDTAALAGKHRTVAVIGGGDTAIDVCRSARRLGAERVHLLYRRTKHEIPARLDELVLAEEEGIEMHFLCTVAGITENDNLLTLDCINMELSEPDYPDGRRNVVPSQDSKFSLTADVVVTALGFTPALALKLPVDDSGYLKVKRDGVSTSIAGLFAGGDITGRSSTVIGAVASGKAAAQAIDNFVNMPL